MQWPDASVNSCSLGQDVHFSCDDILIHQAVAVQLCSQHDSCQLQPLQHLQKHCKPACAHTLSSCACCLPLRVPAALQEKKEEEEGKIEEVDEEAEAKEKKKKTVSATAGSSSGWRCSSAAAVVLRMCAGLPEQCCSVCPARLCGQHKQHHYQKHCNWFECLFSCSRYARSGAAS